MPTVSQSGGASRTAVTRDTFASVLSNTQLLRLDFGVFILHMVLTAVFVVAPLILRDHYAIDPASHWQVYLAVLVLSLLLMVPAIIFSEKLNMAKLFFLIAILLCGIGQLSMGLMHHNFVWFFAAMVIYFWGFNFLEASLPTMVSKISNPQIKGASMGVYSSSQFFGAFCGGAIAGWLAQEFTQNSVFVFAFIMFLIWFLIAFSMRAPTNYKSYTVNLGQVKNDQAPAIAESLQQLPGVADATVIADEGVAYLRIDRKTFQEDALKTFCAQLN